MLFKIRSPPAWDQKDAWKRNYFLKRVELENEEEAHHPYAQLQLHQKSSPQDT